MNGSLVACGSDTLISESVPSRFTFFTIDSTTAFHWGFGVARKTDRSNNSESPRNATSTVAFSVPVSLSVPSTSVVDSDGIGGSAGVSSRREARPGSVTSACFFRSP